MTRLPPQRPAPLPRLSILAALPLGLSLLAGQAPEVDPSSPGDAPPTPASLAATPRAIPTYRRAIHVAILTIEGGIDGLTLRSLERRVRQARADGADAIAFDIDTPGGELLATLDICELIKNRNDTPSNTVAWVNPMAYSAGTIISLACREIVVAPNASFGDAAPINPLMPLPQTERAKQEAPILTEVVDSARRNHYDENLVQAFISVGIELWLIENNTTGDRIFVDRNEYERVFGEPPPDQMTPVAPPKPQAGVTPVQPWFNNVLPRTPQEEGEPLTEEERLAQFEFSQLLPPVRLPLDDDARGQWTLITQVVTNDRLLTMRPTETIHYGLAKTVIANDAELKAFFGASTLTRYDRSWSESMVRLLVSLPVRAVLLVIFLIALFVELAAPGLGVFGATALVALLMLVGAPFLAGMAQWWDVLLIVVGVLLVAAELFVIPGFGVAGVAGAACLLIGMVGTFVSGDLSTPLGQTQLVRGLLTTFTSVFVAGLGIWLLSRWFHTFPFLNRVVLSADLSPSGRPGAAVGLLEAMGPPTSRALEPGEEGLADTDLRPAGKAKFNNRIIDVKSVGEFIDRGTPVRVVSVGRFVIEVEDART